MKPIEFDITNQLDKFNKLAKDMPYIISRSINDIAFEHGRREASEEIHEKMEVRNKAFSSQKSIRIKKSSKKDLKVTLYHFKEQMGLQQYGGIERPEGSKLAIPIRKNLSTYAGIPNNKQIPKSLSINTIMAKAPKKKGEPAYKTKGIMPFVLKRGVYIRTSTGLRIIYAFADKAAHDKKLLKMQETIEKTYNINLEKYIERNYINILKGD